MANAQVSEQWESDCLHQQGPQDEHGGSNYSDEKAILKDAFGRMVAVVQQDHVIGESYEKSPVLVGVNVVVRSSDNKVLPPMGDGHQDCFFF